MDALHLRACHALPADSECIKLDPSYEFKCTGKYGCGKRGNYRYINGEFVRAVSGTAPKLSPEQARAVILSLYRQGDWLLRWMSTSARLETSGSVVPTPKPLLICGT